MPNRDAKLAPPFALPGAAEHPPELAELAAESATHWPAALHTFGATQSFTDVQVVSHFPVPSLQTYGEQSVEPASPAPASAFVDLSGLEQIEPPVGATHFVWKQRPLVH
jgi:hypothetical protein